MDSRKDQDELLTVLRSAFKLEGELQLIYGDQDLNYKLHASDSTYLVKVSSFSKHQRQLQAIDPLLEQLQNQELQVSIPQLRTTSLGKNFAVLENQGDKAYVRVFDWIEGRLWADVQPKTSTLRRRLGQEAGRLQSAIRKYTAPPTEQPMRWDLAQSAWTEAHAYDFDPQRAEWVRYFQDLFREAQPVYQELKKGWTHNDLNDYNILLSKDTIEPEIAGFIDFGDCCFTQRVNELAILLTYAIMEAPEPIGAALEVIEGYHAYCPLEERELEVLYALVGMRLVTSVCVSHLRKQEQPDDPYLTISEAPAWALMEKWFDIPSDLAHFAFRKACGLKPHPAEKAFIDWAKKQDLSIRDLFPTQHDKDKVFLLDLKPSSTWIGGIHDFNDLDRFTFAIERLQSQHPDCFIAGGYLEPRPLYTSTSYDRPGNSGPESRTVHLGVDVWLPAGTAVHAPFDGEIFTRTNDAGYKEYGGLIILKHEEEGIEFYTLYGHLSADSPAQFDLGEKIRKGQQLGTLGDQRENGVWSPHLHFQVMLHMLDYIVDFPGVAYKSELDIWKSICPDPNLWFKQKELYTRYDHEPEELITQRRDTLGPNLSLSYDRPLHIVRGQGAYIMDSWGRQYLDTVNNVAHVGHEHPRVVAAGQKQMAVLNTNTRYLHEGILDYANELRKSLPKDLEVIYLVNSGSEANELALRMVRAATGSPHMLAIEMGYHGNTNAVIGVSSYKFDRKGGGGAPAHTHLLPVPDTFRGKHREDNAAEAYASYSREQIAALERQGYTLGGFIHESILSCAGQIDPPEGYLQMVYEEVRKAGGICIADEVQTGFGRVGSHFWAFERAGIQPDIVAMGKPAGNGHPLGILACTREVAEAFANGMEFFNTFGGNPVSCAIGLEVLKVIKEEGLQANALSTGEILKHGLMEMATDFPIISNVRGSGLFLGVELTDRELNPLTEKTHYLVNRMRDFGILTSSDGPHENVLKIKPPMVFGREQAETLLHRLRQVLAEDYMKID